jgi:cytidylate kinase
VQAPDAQLIDTTGMDVGQVEEAVLKVVRDRTSNGKTASFAGNDLA